MDDDIIKAFGKRVKDLRLKKGLSQEKLADLAGLDRTYISHIERGTRSIGLTSIKKLADAFDIEIHELLKLN